MTRKLTLSGHSTEKAIISIINLIESTVKQATHYDPIIMRSIQFRRACHLTIKIDENSYKDVLRRAEPSKLTGFFENI